MSLLIGRGSLGRHRKFRPKPNKLHLLQNKSHWPFRAKQPTWLLYTVFSTLFFCTFNPISKGRSIRTTPNSNEDTLLCELRTWSPWTERTEHQTYSPLKQGVFQLGPRMRKDPYPSQMHFQAKQNLSSKPIKYQSELAQIKV